MKAKNIMTLIACAGIFIGCTATVPKELVSARDAFQTAQRDLAAQLAPAELHVAEQALAKAEKSFINDPDSYKTRDLAYVAQRKAEFAHATAYILAERKIKNQAKEDYQTTQGTVVENTKQDLSDTRAALSASERNGDKNEKALNETITALASSEDQGKTTKQDLNDTRTALAASERSGEIAADRLSAEKEARLAAEKQLADSQAALAKLAAVKEDTRGLVITLSGSVLFASNQAVLLPSARAKLDQVSDVLLTTRERNLDIEGHTDSQGTDSSNIDLSQRRADAVRDYLVKRGYQADLIKANGMGEGHPIADNANAEGRANNRRVEIIIERDLHSSN